MARNRWAERALRAVRTRHDESGMSLLELVVAFTLFAILMVGIAHSMASGLALTRTNRHRSVAANLAAQEMDAMRSAEFGDVTAGDRTVDVEGISYRVFRSLDWHDEGASGGACDASGGTPRLLRLRITVTWPDMNGIPPVVSDTTLMQPVSIYDANTGHVGVKVTGLDGEGVFNVPVDIAGPETHATRTNTEGCAFFPFLTPGIYTVTLSAFGYVDL